MKPETVYFQITLASPLHIGCGEVYEPMGFIIDEENRELVSFNPSDFLNNLSSDELRKFSAVCSEGTVESIQELYKFMRLYRNLANGDRVAVSEGFYHHYQDVLDKPRDQFKKEVTDFAINRTAFNPIKNEPVIPGSSLKGAIRTAVLNGRESTDPQQKRNFDQVSSGQLWRETARESNKLQQNHLGGSFDKDPFRLIKFSDFMPVGKVNRKVCYAVNFSKKNGEKKLPQLLEVIESGSRFWGSITILPSPGTNEKTVAIDEIIMALQHFFGAEKKREDRELTKISGQPVALASDQGVPLRVGHHSGAECVTINGHRHIKISPPGKPAKFSAVGASTIWLASNQRDPKTLGKTRPMGWVLLSLLSENQVSELRKKHKQSLENWQQQFVKKQEEIALRQETVSRQREAERQEQERLVEEQRQQEEELRKHPWRSLLPGLERISDWGNLKTQVLEHEDYKQYQAEKEVGRAVAETALRVAKNNRKKWNSERDNIVADWLQASGTTWERQSVEASVAKNPLLEKILAFKTPADYDRSLDFTVLDIECCRTLQPLFKKWNWDKKKKAKANNHKLWKSLQERIQQLTT
jgi:CRISPR-associated protein Csm5